jgi:hypothetical protein
VTDGKGSKGRALTVVKAAPVEALVDILAGLISESIHLSFFRLFRSRHDTKVEFDIRKRQVDLLQTLSQAGIDPSLFDLMLSNELDRTLKKQFGVAFLTATIFFTLLSFAVIILNSAQKWGISDTAITALVIETPIQFIGLLYIIARNLFPQSPNRTEHGRSWRARRRSSRYRRG